MQSVALVHHFRCFIPTLATNCADDRTNNEGGHLRGNCEQVRADVVVNSCVESSGEDRDYHCNLRRVAYAKRRRVRHCCSPHKAAVRPALKMLHISLAGSWS